MKHLGCTDVLKGTLGLGGVSFVARFARHGTARHGAAPGAEGLRRCAHSRALARGHAVDATWGVACTASGLDASCVVGRASCVVRRASCVMHRPLRQGAPLTRPCDENQTSNVAVGLARAGEDPRSRAAACDVTDTALSPGCSLNSVSRQDSAG